MKVVNNSQNEGLKNNFVAVFPTNEMKRFIGFHSVIRLKSNAI